MSEHYVRQRRASAIAKLKRAASLPRMRDGRRPPMHAEVNSDPEHNPDSNSTPDSRSPSQPPPADLAPESSLQSEVHHPVDLASQKPALQSQDQELLEEERPEVDREEAEADVDTDVLSTTPEPGPSRRKKRPRSRSKSRSRNSKDMRRKSPVSSNPFPDESSQDEAGPSFIPAPIAVPALAPLLSPTPFNVAEMHQARLFRSPTPGSPFSTSPTPTPGNALPTLEQIVANQGLFRSNSARQLGRNAALSKLTGGLEQELAPSPSPSLQPKLSRNHTVSGGERLMARKNLLTRLNSRAKTPVKDLEDAGKDEHPVSPAPPSPTPLSPATSPVPPSPVSSPPPTGKRKRRRSRHRKDSLGGTAGQSDSEYLSSRSNTPMISSTPVPVNVLPISQTPNPPEPEETVESHVESAPSMLEELLSEPRRRSVLIEDDYNSPPSPPPTLPPLYPRLSPNRNSPRIPHSSDPPSNASTDDDPDAVTLPVYLSQTMARPDAFPRSPFGTPHKERPSYEDDEEQVIYGADEQEREISWVASPVPEIRMPIHDDDDDDEEDVEVDVQVRDVDHAPRYSQGYGEETYDSSARGSAASSKSLIIEDTNGDLRMASPSPSSGLALSQDVSRHAGSDDSVSPKVYPMPMTVASPRPQFGALHADTDPRDDYKLGEEPQSPPPSTWSRVKHTLTRSSSSAGRRSRAESISRERQEHTDSSVSRESGASMANYASVPGTLQPIHQSPPHSASNSGSMLSLTGQSAPRSGSSPMPSASSTDISKYNYDAKLFPFPGFITLEEQRNRSNGTPLGPNGTYGTEDLRHRSSSSLGNVLEGRERTLSHHASDSQLPDKSVFSSPYAPESASPPPEQLEGGSGMKLPKGLGVKKWLTKNKKSSAQGSISPPLSPNMISPPVLNGHSPSLSNLVNSFNDTPETSLRWQDSSASNTNDDTVRQRPGLSAWKEATDLSTSVASTDTSVTQKPVNGHGHHRSIDAEASYLNFDGPMPSPPDVVSMTTPEPQSSSWSDYPAHSSSSSSSSLDLGIAIEASKFAQAGASVLERLEESLARGSRSPMWASAIDEPPRKLILSSPVLQVVNANTVKDRFLFLFSDVLVIAKPVMQDEENVLDIYSKRSTLDKKFVVKSAVSLSQVRFSDGRIDQSIKHNSQVRNPVLDSFVYHFSRDPELAIASVCAKTRLREDPINIAHLLFRTLELDRARLGEYLSRRSSRAVFKTYLDKFGFVGMRIDKALRAFLLSIHLFDGASQNYSIVDYLLDVFASRWYEANARIVPYDRDLAVRLVRAIVQLNELLHGEIASEPGPTGFPGRNVTLRDFIDAFRRYDSRLLVSDDYLEKIYESIRYERLAQAPASSLGSATAITLKRPLPSRLTYKVQSEPVILRIPHPDPHLLIHLHGKDLVFEPRVLSFTKSAEASFRVTGMALGTRTILMSRSGPNALMYTSLPLSSPVIVERAFMRNTFQLAFKDHRGDKRRYMFSVDDPLIRHQWAVSLRGNINNAAETTGKSEFHRAVETMAFRILQNTLLGLEGSRSPSMNSLGPSASHISREGRNMAHVRSKSRSKMYHQHGAGRNELDLITDHPTMEASLDSSSSRTDERIWTGQELHLQCQQNSSIPLVLSYLQVGTPDYEVPSHASV